jgi:NADH-quinone oxidoreductase subunit L
MEGPTPVSALMHAATLVTTGCILLVKLNYILSQYFFIIFFNSLVTAIFCSTRAIFEFDFKKIVALSTAAQMSVVFLFISLGKFVYAIVYLTLHVVFKALLF